MQTVILAEERELSFQERCLPCIHEYYPEQIFRNSSFVIATAVAAIFASPLAYVFSIAASAQLLTVSVLKIYVEYNEDEVSRIQLEAMSFKKNYPWLQTVAFIVTLAVFFIFPPASGLLGGLLGLYAGILADSTYYKRLQTIPDDYWT